MPQKNTVDVFAKSYPTALATLSENMSTADLSIQEVPPHFYKYRAVESELSFQRLEEIVIESKIFFSSPKSLNDPFDCRPAHDFGATRREMRDELNRLQKQFSPHMNREARRKTRDTIFNDPVWNPRSHTAQTKFRQLYDQEMDRNGVLCLSACPNDILMWTHYADSHRGVCLQFASEGHLMSSAQRVNYSRTRPQIAQYTRVDHAISFERAMLTKSTHWKYEQEWRIVKNQPDTGPVRSQPGSGPARFPYEELTGLIFGVQTLPDMIVRVRDMVTKRPVPLTLYRAEINSANYEIKIVPL